MGKGFGRFGPAGMVMWAAAGMAAAPAFAQYPGQVKASSNAPQLRAVAVVEWLGDLQHPKACRVIPISVYDGHQLQDAGIYLARPAPLALLTETEYELQKDGRNVGLFDIGEAAQQQGSWIGFGAYKPLPKGPTPQQLAAAAAQQKVDVDDDDSDEPILHRKYHPGDAGNGKTEAKTGPPAPAPDPDRPRLSDASGSSDAAGSAPPPDPDRPRLTADDPSKSSPTNAQNPPGQDVAHVEDLPNITDPDRPRLVRGQPANYGPSVKPTVMGLPPEMKQEVAVSDARKIAEHPWDYKWANPGDEDKMKAAMEEIARKALGLDPPPAPAPASTTRHTSTRHKTAPAPPPPAPLQGEHFRVFELEYGSGATMVLSAHTKGAGADEKFVTLIAQPDLYGGVAVLDKHLTDAAHLDMNPRMRLIDAVDAENDNRGELLFELRGQTQRQFTLYRVLRGQATQIFTTGALGTGSGVAE
ncbi:MAG: hypothetical protein ACLGP3_00325 [Acidobacteriota bacterium]